MRVDALHRRIASDVLDVHHAIADVIPARMPKGLDSHDVLIRKWVNKLHDRTLPFKVANVVENSSETPVGKMYHTGQWDEPKERVHGCDVKVVFFLNPKTKRFRWTTQAWNRRRTFYYEMLMHELIHRHQPSANGQTKKGRQYRPTAASVWTAEMQEYKGNCDEIEAYAHDTALEYFIHWPDATYRDASRNAYQVKDPQTPPTVITFSQTFENDTKHPALMHFYRKTRAWFDLIHAKADFYQGLELAKVY